MICFVLIKVPMGLDFWAYLYVQLHCCILLFVDVIRRFSPCQKDQKLRVSEDKVLRGLNLREK